MLSRSTRSVGFGLVLLTVFDAFFAAPFFRKEPESPSEAVTYVESFALLQKEVFSKLPSHIFPIERTLSALSRLGIHIPRDSNVIPVCEERALLVDTSKCARMEYWNNSGSPLSPTYGHLPPIRTSVRRSDALEDSLDCRPCANHALHGVAAGTRRRYSFRAATYIYCNSSTQCEMQQTWQAPSYWFVNWWSMFLSQSILPYNETTHRYYRRGRSREILAPAIAYVNESSVVLFSVTPSDGIHVVVLHVSAGAMRAIHRVLYTIYDVPVISLIPPAQQLCRPVSFPYTPCATHIMPRGDHEWSLFPRYVFPNDTMNTSVVHSPARIGVGMGGFLRSYQKTLTTFREMVTGSHRGNLVDVYVSTWNVAGQNLKGVLERKDITWLRKASTTRHLTKELHPATLQYFIMHKFEQHSDRHFDAPVGFPMHIMFCVRAMRNASILYDAVILTRPDVLWKKHMYIIVSDVKNSVILEYRGGIGKRSVHRLVEGVVIVDRHDSLFWGNTYMAGDWAMLGTPRTMLAWEHLYNYSIDNYVSQGGGILNAAFMAEVGQTWVVGDLTIALHRKVCALRSAGFCLQYEEKEKK